MSPVAAGTKKKLMEALSEKNQTKFLPEGWVQGKWEEYGPYTALVLKKGKETVRVGFTESGSGMGYYATAHGMEIALLGDVTTSSEEAKVTFDRIVRYFIELEM